MKIHLIEKKKIKMVYSNIQKVLAKVNYNLMKK